MIHLGIAAVVWDMGVTPSFLLGPGICQGGSREEHWLGRRGVGVDLQLLNVDEQTAVAALLPAAADREHGVAPLGCPVLRQLGGLRGRVHDGGAERVDLGAEPTELPEHWTPQRCNAVLAVSGCWQQGRNGGLIVTVQQMQIDDDAPSHEPVLFSALASAGA